MAGVDRSAASTGENFAAVVQEARRILAGKDEAEIIAFILGAPVGRVREVMGADDAAK